MAQYLISVWHDDDYTENDFAAGLQPQSTATVVRAVDGDVSMTDGPYAETQKHMGGFWVIDVPDLDTAREWAAKCAAACEGPVELRPMQVG